jgi:EAL domain-containing protein (putative c-di-GMP-specific phosphodiesterase class I)
MKAADKTGKRIEIAAQKTPARRHSNECRWQPDSRLIVASAFHPAARRPANIAQFDRQVQTAEVAQLTHQDKITAIFHQIATQPRRCPSPYCP